MAKEEKCSTMVSSGALAIIAGIVAIGWHFVFGMAPVLFLGILLCAAGVVQLLPCCHGHGRALAAGGMAAALVAVAAGVLLLVLPSDNLTITIILSSYFLLNALIRFAAATVWHEHHCVWPWALLSALVAIVFAAVLWINLDGSIEWLNGLLVGVDLIVLGWAHLCTSRHCPTK